MNLHGKHFLSTQDYTTEELTMLLDRAISFKQDGHGPLLAGKVLCMLFLNPSLRTRVSFEVAMLQLGGSAIPINSGTDSWKLELEDGSVMDQETQEHVKDAARVLGRYAHALAVRSFPAGKDWGVDSRDPVLRGFAADARVPVINMESAVSHPCQAMADVMTMKEHWGDLTGKKLLVNWAWHPRALPMAVPNAMILLASRFGMDVTIARPQGYALPAEIMSQVRENSHRSGGRVTEVEELDPAFAGVHAVYAKSWGSLERYGKPEEEARLRAPLRSWIVNEERMRRTEDGIFLHCLPVRRNVEVTDQVLDGPWSQVYREAENRLHVQKAILASILEHPR